MVVFIGMVGFVVFDEIVLMVWFGMIVTMVESVGVDWLIR